jgi:hypothetical protein
MDNNSYSGTCAKTGLCIFVLVVSCFFGYVTGTTLGFNNPQMMPPFYGKAPLDTPRAATNVVQPPATTTTASSVEASVSPMASAAAEIKPAAPAQPPSSAPSASADSVGETGLTFNPVTDRDALFAKYPFLKSAEEIDSIAEVTLGPDQLLFATTSDCARIGCGFKAYVSEKGAPFAPAMDITFDSEQGVVTVVRDKGANSVVFCTAEQGAAEWKLQNHAFVLQEKVTAPVGPCE